MLYYLVAEWVGSACLTEVASGENFEFCRGLLLVVFFAVDVKLSIGNVLLEEDRTAFSAGIDEPDFSVVVLGESPLATIWGDFFFFDRTVCESKAVFVVGGVEPVVLGPD
jgi:hypothetical protein